MFWFYVSSFQPWKKLEQNYLTWKPNTMKKLLPSKSLPGFLHLLIWSGLIWLCQSMKAFPSPSFCMLALQSGSGFRRCLASGTAVRNTVLFPWVACVSLIPKLWCSQNNPTPWNFFPRFLWNLVNTVPFSEILGQNTSPFTFTRILHSHTGLFVSVYTGYPFADTYIVNVYIWACTSHKALWEGDQGLPQDHFLVAHTPCKTPEKKK